MKILSAVSRSYSRTHCVMCDKELTGRRDKKFCSLQCKNNYRDWRTIENQIATAEIDRRLHRNRTILIELYEEAGTFKFICPRNRLVRKGFSFKNFTSLNLNKVGKTYFHVYDYSWMEFSSTDVLIVKKIDKKLKKNPQKTPHQRQHDT